MATAMGQQKQPQIQNHVHVNEGQGGEGCNASGEENSRTSVAGNYIHEEMMSPSSLLRSDRFARSKRTPAESILKAKFTDPSAELSRSSDNIAENYSSADMSLGFQEMRRPTTTPNPQPRRNKPLEKRGEAPAKVRPRTAGACAENKILFHSQQQRKHNQEIAGASSLDICILPHSPEDSGFFSNSLFGDGSDGATSYRAQSGRLSDSPLVCQRQISQSPLRRGFAPSAGASCDGRFQQSPMRSKAVDGSPRQVPRKMSESEPASRLDWWSSRCRQLTQQISEHLRSCHEPSLESSQASSSPRSGGRISTSPLLNRPGSIALSSRDGSISLDWLDREQMLPDPVNVTRAMLSNFATASRGRSGNLNLPVETLPNSATSG